MKKIIFLLIAISSSVFASGGETDIVQRTVNFLLFAGIIYYLVSEPIKGFFASRSKSIADEMKKVQDRLRESAELKKEAMAKNADALKFAEDLAITSKKENKLLSDGILAQCEQDMQNMAKQQASLIDFEQRKMVREVVESILAEAVDGASASFDREAMANLILKKVA
ncbi:MAG: F0F1 ATP synthase subunit B [Sulfuricurvum sp.]